MTDSVTNQLRAVLVKAYRKEAPLRTLMRELKKIVTSTNENYYLRGNVMGRYSGKGVYMFDKATSDDINGTSLQGYVDVPYSVLVDVFGQPVAVDYYKIDAEWELKFQGVPFTIYNYKDGINYNGDQGTPIEKITEWHIGGHSIASFYAVKFILAKSGKLDQENGKARLTSLLR